MKIQICVGLRDIYKLINNCMNEFQFFFLSVKYSVPAACDIWYEWGSNCMHMNILLWIGYSVESFSNVTCCDGSVRMRVLTLSTLSLLPCCWSGSFGGQRRTTAWETISSLALTTTTSEYKCTYNWNATIYKKMNTFWSKPYEICLMLKFTLQFERRMKAEERNNDKLRRKRMKRRKK